MAELFECDRCKERVDWQDFERREGWKALRVDALPRPDKLGPAEAWFHLCSKCWDDVLRVIQNPERG